MTTLYKTSSMEDAANLLAEHFSHVLVHAAYRMKPPIRFRADLCIDHRIFFLRFKGAERQQEAWVKNGGIAVDWSSKLNPFLHDAIVFTECPVTINALKWWSSHTNTVSVVYQPPTWRLHEEYLEFRSRGWGKMTKERKWAGFHAVKEAVETAPVLTPSSLDPLLRAQREAQAQRLCVRVLPADEAHSADTDPRVP